MDEKEEAKAHREAGVPERGAALTESEAKSAVEAWRDWMDAAVGDRFAGKTVEEVNAELRGDDEEAEELLSEAELRILRSETPQGRELVRLVDEVLGYDSNKDPAHG